jgi:hypothetical protein
MRATAEAPRLFCDRAENVCTTDAKLIPELLSEFERGNQPTEVDHPTFFESHPEFPTFTSSAWILIHRRGYVSLGNIRRAGTRCVHGKVVLRGKFVAAD